MVPDLHVNHSAFIVAATYPHHEHGFIRNQGKLINKKKTNCMTSGLEGNQDYLPDASN